MQCDPKENRPQVQLPTLHLGNVCFLDIEDIKGMQPADLADLMRRLVATQNPPEGRPHDGDSAFGA